MQTFDLWQSTPALREGEEPPKIHFFPADKQTHKGCVVIFPGGGYTFRATHEGEEYAEFLSDQGFPCFVVDYRVYPNLFPAPLLDGRRAVQFVRANADLFGIDPQRVAVMGSSAGGNLAALVSTCEMPLPEAVRDEIDRQSFLPNAQILCYPYVSLADDQIRIPWCEDKMLDSGLHETRAALSPELCVKETTPQAFFFHTSDDDVVDVRHSLRYADKLSEHGIPVEMHIFPHGPHGLGLARTADGSYAHVAQWGSLLVRWLTYIGY